jgi:uncharacterized membrane protein
MVNSNRRDRYNSMIYNLHEMITTPILITTLYIMANPSASTQNVQFLFICSIGYHMLIVPLSLVIDDEICETKSDTCTFILTMVIAIILWITQTIIIADVISNNLMGTFFGLNLFLLIWKMFFLCLAKIQSPQKPETVNMLFYCSRYVHALMIFVCLGLMKTNYIDTHDIWSKHLIIWANVIGELA